MVERNFCGERGLRERLISAAVEFARRASLLQGVDRIALTGSITTVKPEPKDIDVLVTIGEAVDLPRLAKLGRRLKGAAQQMNAGADIFLLDRSGKYIGRTCRYKECPSITRTTCKADNCGRIPHLCDDLAVIDLNGSPTVIISPPVIVFPQLMINGPLPPDLSRRVESGFES